MPKKINFIVFIFALWIQTSGFTQATGKALFLDGIDDGVVIREIDQSMNSLSTELTIEAWIFTVPPVNSPYPRIIDRSDNITDDRWLLQLNMPDNGPALNINRNVTSSVCMPHNQWEHVATTYNGSTATIYLNGEIVGTGYYSTIIDVKDSDIYIGNESMKIRPFSGAIDELRVWNKARTQEEIIRTMNGSLEPSYYCTADSGLIAYWQFDTLATVYDGSDSLIYIMDTSLNNNHGILFGGATIVSPIPKVPMLINFSLLSPSDDSTLEATTVTFTWEDAAFPETAIFSTQVEYDVYIAKDLSFNEPMIKTVVGELSIKINHLINEQTYFWKVLAKNSLGETLWSSNVNGFYIQPGLSDFGDAPYPFKTMASENGARHYINPNVYLGWGVDSEYDGCVDSLAACDSDDGVYFLNQCIAGDTLIARLRTSCGGFLSCWIYTPYNRAYHGSDQANVMMKRIDQIIDDGGIHDMAIPISIYSAEGVGYLRFRFSSEPIDSSFGQAVDGEVEDYRIQIYSPEMDFGDAPWPFKTLLDENGARHIIDPGVYLGSGLSADEDGVADSLAAYDFDDGIVLPDEWVAGDAMSLTVIVSCPGYLTAWLCCPLEYNLIEDSTFSLTRTDYYLSVKGQNKLKIPVPAYADSGITYVRFRFSTVPVDSSFGPAINGEVEDYRISIQKSSVLISDNPEVVPDEYQLAQNFPNPFNYSTKIVYSLRESSNVNLKIMNTQGQIVKTLVDQQQPAGSYSIHWNGEDDLGLIACSGIYFIYLQANDYCKTRKLILMK